VKNQADNHTESELSEVENLLKKFKLPSTDPDLIDKLKDAIVLTSKNDKSIGERNKIIHFPKHWDIFHSLAAVFAILAIFTLYFLPKTNNWPILSGKTSTFPKNHDSIMPITPETSDSETSEEEEELDNPADFSRLKFLPEKAKLEIVAILEKQEQLNKQHGGSKCKNTIKAIPILPEHLQKELEIAIRKQFPELVIPEKLKETDTKSE